MTNDIEAIQRHSDWTVVDRGSGHAVEDFATLSEPANVREYVSMHEHLRIGPGERLLDIACGSGLAVELAQLRCTVGAGIDPQNDSSLSLATATRTRTFASATCTRSRGTTEPSTSSRASAGPGARPRTHSPRRSEC